MPDVATPSYIAIVCPLCSVVRYRSSRPYIQGERPEPSDFVPENGAPEVTIGTTIPLCHECGAAMEPRLDNMGASSVVEPEARTSAARVRIPSPQTPVQTLFQPDVGETILQIKDTTGGFVIATSKRVVKIGV